MTRPEPEHISSGWVDLDVSTLMKFYETVARGFIEVINKIAAGTELPPDGKFCGDRAGGHVKKMFLESLEKEFARRGIDVVTWRDDEFWSIFGGTDGR